MSEYDDKPVPEISPARGPEPFPAAEDTAAIPVYSRTATEGARPAATAVEPAAVDDDGSADADRPGPDATEAAGSPVGMRSHA
ncbi:hypothetical protein [Streptomyces sp. SYSU K217416]